MSIQFHWEKLNQYIQIKPHLSYVFYYNGCFCPPHAGHFATASEYLKYPNVQVIIHQMGTERRHGVPKRLNRQIWKFYIKRLLDARRIDLLYYSTMDKSSLLQNHPWIKKADVIVLLKGDEYSDVKKTNNEVYKRYRNLLSIYGRTNKRLEIVYGTRNHEKLSATTLVKRLLEYKQRLIPLYNLYEFFPKGLSIGDKNFLIKILLKCPLS